MGRGRRLPLVLALIALAGCGGGAKGGAGTGSTTASPGGEASIEGFGSEIEGAERSALLAAFHSYLKAVGAKDYPAACSRLAGSVKRSLARLATPGNPSCARLLQALLSPEAAALARVQSEGAVTRARAQGERGFVVFKAPGAKLYDMPMSRVGGQWKVGLLANAVLVPSTPLSR